MTAKTRTWLEDLPPESCADLLEHSWLGRLGVITAGHPEIFPVNHVYERETGCVVFPTGAGTKLHTALSSTLVAFEVDGVDDDGAGWSVMMVGSAEEETDPGAIARFTGLRRSDWALSERSHWLRIRPGKVTGRRIYLVE